MPVWLQGLGKELRSAFPAAVAAHGAGILVFQVLWQPTEQGSAFPGGVAARGAGILVFQVVLQPMEQGSAFPGGVASHGAGVHPAVPRV